MMKCICIFVVLCSVAVINALPYTGEYQAPQPTPQDGGSTDHQIINQHTQSETFGMNGETDFFEMHLVSDDRMKRDTWSQMKKELEKHGKKYNSKKTTTYKKSNGKNQTKVPKSKVQ